MVVGGGVLFLIRDAWLKEGRLPNRLCVDGAGVINGRPLITVLGKFIDSWYVAIGGSRRTISLVYVIESEYQVFSMIKLPYQG